ncbi:MULTISPECIES: hypothetical protein [Caballeronia]|uniref:hypothetical protein n=1 Tax=Caballeronia TaxID=1827195 RepID=UPI001EF67475|nr:MULTISPECIES: hypothetical protein [Caballeronia]MCG7400487.1 hypothetical protein [Caballeronia zhejiangensis]
MYDRYCILATAMHLPSLEETSIRQFLDHMKSRMETKAVRLQALLPGISIESSRDAIARASVMPDWKYLENQFGLVETSDEFKEQAWQFIDTAAASFEPSVDEMPLAALPRVVVRTFADRLASTLAIDAPHAYQLTAELMGASNWLELAGPKPFVPIAEPLYSYSVEVVDGEEYAQLEPCLAARRHDEEFEALTVSRQLIFQGDVAQNESVDRPSLLSAAATIVRCRLLEEQYDLVDWKGRAAVAELDKIYPVDCRRPLAPASKTHQFYIQLRTAVYAAYLHTGNLDLAYTERDVLVARGREYRADYERLLKEWAPRGAKAHKRTALRIV